MGYSLALAGGAVKGASYLAFFEELEKYLKKRGFKKKNGFYTPSFFDHIAFTSSASLFTSAYFLGYQLEDFFGLSSGLKKKLNMAVRFIAGRNYFYSVLDYLFKDKTIGDLPFNAIFVSSDLVTGKKVLLTDESILLRDAIYASSCQPLALEPLKYKGWLLIDGGAVELLPSKTLKELYNDPVVGVRLNNGFKKEHSFKFFVNKLLRYESMGSEALVDELEKYCDVMIRPLKSTKVRTYEVLYGIKVFDKKKMIKYYNEAKSELKKELKKLDKLGPR